MHASVITTVWRYRNSIIIIITINIIIIIIINFLLLTIKSVNTESFVMIYVYSSCVVYMSLKWVTKTFMFTFMFCAHWNYVVAMIVQLSRVRAEITASDEHFRTASSLICIVRSQITDSSLSAVNI